MKIKTKILWTLLGMSLLVALVGALAVNRLNATATVAVTKEAQDVARVVSFLLTSGGSNQQSASAQEIVVKLHQTQGWDVVLMDSNQLILAAALPSQIGRRFTQDQGDQVATTIKDRQVRTFVEVNRKYPAGVRQIVVPVEGESGQVIGALVLEYTPLYNELMQLTRGTIRHVVLTGFCSVAIALLIAFYVGRSVARPLQQLTTVATGFASGRTDLPMPAPRKDEIGVLATAFDNMVQKRQRAESKLRRLRDELEVRVVERVAELAKANEALRTENTERKRVEETLRESEEKFRQFADNITDVFWMTSPDLSAIHYVSAGYELIWGRSTESLYTNPHQWVEAILSEDRERAFGVFARLMENVPEVSVEYRVARPDGTVRWVHDRGFQVRDSAGNLLRLAGIATDITERKQSEEVLQRQKTELQVLFDLTPAMIFFKDTENGILRVNKRLAEMIGKSVEEIEGKPSPEILSQEEAKYYADDLEVIHSRMPKLGIVETIRDREGKEVLVQTDKVPVCDQAGKVTGIVVMCQDITERNRAEEALRLLNSAVVQSREAILITDAALDLPGPKIVFVNPAFTQMTGYTAAEAIGRTPRILQGSRTDKTVLNRLRQNLERGEVFEGEVINYRKDGKEFDLEWQITPLRDTSGKITHFLAIQRDITTRKRFEAQLFQSQKMETVGKLAGGVAHEFNSIMTAIIGQSEFLLDDLPAGSPLGKNALEIRRAAGRAATLTRQLLAYGRKQLLQPENLDLNQVIGSMEGMFHHLMGGNVDMQIVPGHALQSVQADAGQIEQVIMNMAINARDAMPNGGKLMLETANISIDEESVGRYPEMKPGDYVMLAITDTGLGMSPEVKARAFEPFFSTKEVGRGTGLGLSTCYGIIKQSGGHISVYSEPARGATFKIYLPQVERPTRIPIQRLDAPDLPRGTETVLLVEDDPALREMASILLRRLGYTVLAAANGMEALSLKQQRDIGHIDLLFTDIVMPHMSGKELSERVQAVYPQTKVLFTSAYTENAILHQGVLNKGLALLQKPFTPSALAHKLRAVLDQSSAPVTEAAAQKE
jgi:two-component system, cell cycle sensor histidine kinase and response regulator CckA